MTVEPPALSRELAERISSFVRRLEKLGRKSADISHAVVAEVRDLERKIGRAPGAAIVDLYIAAIRESFDTHTHPAIAYLKIFTRPAKDREREITVAQRIPLFLQEIAALGLDRRRIRGKVLAEHKWLRQHYRLHYVRVVLSRYRSAAAYQFGSHPVVHMLHGAMDDMEHIKEVGRQNVYEQHANLRPIDPETLVAKALDLLASGHYMQTLAGLLLVTGRRPAELAFSAHFELIDDRDDIIIFGGQLKTKNAQAAQIAPYEIPVLADPKDIIDAIAFCRSQRTFTTAGAVNDKIGKEINTMVRARFGTEYKPKDLRAIYATIAHHDLEDQTISQVAYFARILGHSAGDLVTALSYVRFYVEGRFEKAVVEFARSKADIERELRRRQKAATTDDERRYIQRDIDRLTGSTSAAAAPAAAPAPATSPALEETISTLTQLQIGILGKLLASDAGITLGLAFAKSEKATIDALERRGFVERTFSDDRYAPSLVRLTDLGARAAASLATAARGA